MLHIFKLVPNGYFGSNCYIIESGGEWAVVDPSVEYSVAVRSYPSLVGNLKYILLTHAHFDHIYAIDSWQPENAVVKVGVNDALALSDPNLNCYLGFLGVRDGYFGKYETVDDGDRIILGKEEIEVISTPGHTRGGVSYKCANDVFVGDTLFAEGGYGRCDLPGGDSAELDKSLFKLFSRMPVGRFYPGHGDSATFEDTIKYFS